MTFLDLNGTWNLAREGDSEAIPALVPGCVHLALKAAGRIPDPYFRDNEDCLQWIGETVWVYTRTFEAAPELLACERVLLVSEGLDTFATVTINDREIARSDNMFRRYEWDVRAALREGVNEIKIRFDSTMPYLKKRQEEQFLWHTGIDHHRVNGSNWVRKEQCNYGWDWGPILVTAGIWRDLSLRGIRRSRLVETEVRQHHAPDGVVMLELKGRVETIEPGMSLRFTVSYEGEEWCTREVSLSETTATTSVTLDQPHLWWPNGLGEQALYDVSIELLNAEGESMDFEAKRIGLRTLELVRERDEWGESFHFRCNGCDFFAKGANWIPADTFDAAVTDDILRDLLQSAADAHLNFIRVWGGGVYERDEFYSLCDELGLCVWQDFMFACSAYPAHEPAFLENVRHEAEENVRRLRHHPSIALWCGNNELEQIGGIIGDQPGAMRWPDYVELFDKLLARIVAELDPGRPYWPSSEHSPMGNRVGDGASSDPRWGDAHLWSVWHGRKPFEWYRTSFHRFCSEFGFQSFPHPVTVESYTAPEDRNITSYVMERHQRSPIGNSAIIDYLLSWFRLPVGWRNTVWLSQILQGLAIKYAVEHWRRNMPRCMGAIYWQLNDCWPVASWSSLDYQRRWKALHYEARRFFAPLLISGVEDLASGTLEVWLTSDALAVRDVEVAVDVYTVDGTKVKDRKWTVATPSNGPKCIETMDLSGELSKFSERDLLVKLRVFEGGELTTENLVTFARPKHLALRRPALTIERVEETGEETVFAISTDRPALWVWLEVDEDPDLRWTDNFFTVLPGERKIVRPQDGFGEGLEPARIRLRSLYDTFAEE